MAIKFHPVCLLFPAMSEEEQEALNADVKANGLREDIITFNGDVIDGRNRLLACNQMGVKPRFREWDGKGSLVEFVWSKNLHRRHLNPSQRAAIAAEKAKALELEEAEERTKTTSVPTGPECPEAPPAAAHRPARSRNRQAARDAGASERSTKRARRVMEAAPEVHEQVKAGEITLHAAEQAIAPLVVSAPPKPPGETERAEILAWASKAEPLIRAVPDIDHGKAIDCVVRLEAIVRGKKRVAKRRADIPAGVDPDHVEALLDAYPRRINPAPARVAIVKALQVATFDVLLAAVKEFASSPAGQRGNFTPYPASWFNARGWETDPKEWWREDEGRKKPVDKLAGLFAGIEREPSGHEIAPGVELIRSENRSVPF